MNRQKVARELLSVARELTATEKTAAYRFKYLRVSTGQLWDGRTFDANIEDAVNEAKGDPEILEGIRKEEPFAARAIAGAAKDFAKFAKRETGIDFNVKRGNEFYWHVDMSDWPEDKGFGSWFPSVMRKWGLIIDD